jgi:hypothetical protein
MIEGLNKNLKNTIVRKENKKLKIGIINEGWITEVFLILQILKKNNRCNVKGVFQVYNKALNATEVSQSYESYKANYLNIVTSGSVFLADATNVTSYPGSGTSWYDISGNSNTGSLINGTVYNASSSYTLDGVDDNIEFN